MGYKTKTFKANDAGIRALLKSDESQKVVNSFADSIAINDYRKPYKGYDRAHCGVQTTKETAEKYR